MWWQGCHHLICDYSISKFIQMLVVSFVFIFWGFAISLYLNDTACEYGNKSGIMNLYKNLNLYIN